MADFDPIGLVGVGGVVMVVKADSRINNVQDFIAAAKASCELSIGCIRPG
ncbi:lipoprotein [Bordetella pertussis]|nr:lipoprotein [Bordetella pertussis]CFO82006.1 lipoprotein [Bordetella pertussis]CPI96367.1 lipoprotein [Bordetella pertussis]CPL38862.1 lipoprotein [Bordetella pertussis]CPM84933.1 lipoprotein [Bordetella pertussis]